jgi:hypothetical protein
MIPWPWLNSEAGNGIIQTPYLVMRAYLWDENVADTELNRRGWILQERILSPRIVYSCKDQVFWECRTIHCAETSPNGGPIGLPSRDSTKMDGKLKQLVPGQSLAQYGHLKIEIISNYWSAVVIMYSKCDPTFGRDKLIALSGIAREVQKLIHTGYMAGMWENQLPHSLMWRVSMATCIHRPQLHVAPSWSWASICGTIMPSFQSPYIHTRHLSCMSVLDCRITLVHSKEPFGQVKGGQLRVRGKL